MVEVNRDNIQSIFEQIDRTKDPKKEEKLMLKIVNFYAENIYDDFDFGGDFHFTLQAVMERLGGLVGSYYKYRTKDFADAFLRGFQNALDKSHDSESKRNLLSAFIAHLHIISNSFKEIKFVRHYAAALQRTASYSDEQPVNYNSCKYPITRTILEELSCIVVQFPDDEILRKIYSVTLSNLTNSSMKYKQECSDFLKHLENEFENMKNEKYFPECIKTFENYENLSFSFVLEKLENQFQTRIMRQDERTYSLSRSTHNTICEVIIHYRENFRSKLDLAIFLASLSIDIIDFFSAIEGTGITSRITSKVTSKVTSKIADLPDKIIKLGERNRFEELDEALEELRQFYEEERNEETAQIYSNSLKNAQIDFARKNDFDRLEKTISKLEAVYKDKKTDEVLFSLAISLKLCIHTYAKSKNLEKAEKYYADFKKLTKQIKEPQILTRLVESLYHVINCYNDVTSTTNLDKKVDELLSYNELNIQDKHKVDFIVSGLANSLIYFGKAQDYDQIENYLQKLRDIVIEFTDDKARVCLSHGLYTTAKYYGINQNLGKVQEFVDELEELFEKNPLNEIRTSLAIAYRNASLVFGTLGNLEKMGGFMAKITEFHEEKTNKEILKEMAWVLHNSIEIFSFSDKFNDMDVLLNEFRFLHNNYPDTEVRRLFVRVTKYSIELFSKKAEKKLEKKWIKTLKELHEY